MAVSRLSDSTLFVKTANIRRYFKMSFEGFAGSGKTYTMGMVALGIWRAEGSQHPMVILDTEESSKFLLPIFTKAGLVEGETLFISQSRSLVDFRSILSMCEAEQAICLIDSATHLHEEMQRAYLKERQKRNPDKKRIEMGDHMILKPLWKEQFSDPYVKARCHALFTGRAAWEYDYEVNDDTGKKEFSKAGVKMRGDNEMAFEPDVLVLMSRHQDVTDGGRKIKVWREATIMKDRSTLLDGKLIKNPTFKDFEPTYRFLMTGDATGDKPIDTPMTELIGDDDNSWMAKKSRKVVVLEEIQGLLVEKWPGQSAVEKQAKVRAIKEHFGCRGWAGVEALAFERLERGFETLRDEVEGERSRVEDLDDDVPIADPPAEKTASPAKTRVTPVYATIEQTDELSRLAEERGATDDLLKTFAHTEPDKMTLQQYETTKAKLLERQPKTDPATTPVPPTETGRTTAFEPPLDEIEDV